MACDGNAGETCGGPNRLSLYSSTGSGGGGTSSSGWTSLGCYTDSVSARTLTTSETVPGGTNAMTNELCQTACLGAGYSIAGTEYAGECCK